jgi:adenosylcobinamide-phosphate synthase
VAYKAISTLDSTFGYKNARYLRFGWFSARADDVANYVPARLTVWLMAAGALCTGLAAPAVLRISRRDGRKHASPNAGLPEAAGALGVELGGPVYRAGVLVEGPVLGGGEASLHRGHIRRAVILMLATTVLAAAAGALLRGIATMLARGNG